MLQDNLASPSPTARLSDTAYLEKLTRLIFEIGFRATMVSSRWPNMSRAFGGFEPPFVAALSAEQLQGLSADPGLIRNRAKLAATVDNGRVFVRVAAAHGSFGALLDRLEAQPYEVRAGTLMELLSHVGPRTAHAFLLDVGLADATDDPSL
jgi:3-methyladenine DNA glycosylase Tag